MAFSDILEQTVDEIKPPAPLPVGQYMCIVDGLYKIEQLGANQTTACIFNLKIVQPGPDVDQEQLASNFQEGVGGRSLRHTFWPESDQGLYMLKTFLHDHLGIEKGRRLDMMLAETPGRQVMVTVGHRIDQRDPLNPIVRTEVKGTSKL